MTTTAQISSLMLDLPVQARASLAVELIDSLGDATWDDAALSKLADVRDAELESGAAAALSYSEFLAGLRRPSFVA